MIFRVDVIFDCNRFSRWEFEATKETIKDVLEKSVWGLGCGCAVKIFVCETGKTYIVNGGKLFEA